MADEQVEYGFSKAPKIPEGLDWRSLTSRDGDDLEVHYRHILETLGHQGGLLQVIFLKSQNRIQDPAKLKRLISLIDEETWIGMDIDMKGEIYEGLLQKNAEDTKSGAGQYFTPRALIKAMVEVTRPEPGMAICDPACGTGGFLLASQDFLTHTFRLDKEQLKRLKSETFKGWDIVNNVARLCVMNLYLHGIGGEESPIIVADALATDPGERFDIVLTNPPFGKKSSITIVNGEGKADKSSITYERGDFWATTSNKQLNFLQHVRTILKINGRCAIVVPDNALFEGGAGETVRRKFLSECDLHTILRLPTVIFYAQGVKANVLFFEKNRHQRHPGQKRCGSTISGQTCISHSRPIPYRTRISLILSSVIIPKTGMNESKQNVSNRLLMKSLLHEIR